VPIPANTFTLPAVVLSASSAGASSSGASSSGASSSGASSSGASSSGASSSGASSSGAASSASVTAPVTAVPVVLVTTSSAGDNIVLVPRALTSAPEGFSIVLPTPATVVSSNITSVVTVNLQGEQPLPSWLSFDPATNQLVAKNPPSGGFDLKVEVTVGGVKSIIRITDSEQ
jgi:hypothetical protein